ncbi:MAG: class I SAM-dependent methyltransferase [Gammaproteobacteria bacterium]
MARSAHLLPGARFWERVHSRTARRAVRRNFLLELMPKNALCIEVGVFDGELSERILALTAPRKLHLVDPWRTKADGTLFDGPAQHFDSAQAAADSLEVQFQAVQRLLAHELAAGQVEMHRMLSHEAAPLFPDAHFDWAYLDASHYYDDVKLDLETWFPKIKSGGFITGDDYDRQGFWDHGVTRAVNEFVKANAVEVVAFRNHQFVLRKR